MSGCPVDGCNVTPRPGQLMCLAHWRMVPTTEQRAVNRTWAAYGRHRDMETLNEYRAAKDKAVAAANRESRSAKQGGLF